MSVTPRPYQADAITAAQTAWQDHQSVLLVLPTASGKSVIFSELIRQMSPKRSLVLAHRGELLFQAARHVQRAGLETSIEKAELQVSTSLWTRTPVVVASVQTLISKAGIATRMHKFDPKDFGLIVCDEAHRHIAPSFRSVLNYFKNGNPDIKIVGVTATPDRLDLVSMGEVFETCPFRYEIEQAINDGWLVPVRPLGLRVESLDFSHIPTVAGDLKNSELAAVMEAEKPLYGVAQGSLEAAYYLEPNTLRDVPVEHWSRFLHEQDTPPRSTLCFTVSVRQSEMLSDIFNRVVPGISDWVCGKTAEDRRADINSRFKSGALTILVNCGTHTEGVDVPRAEVIVPKPTKSRSLFTQMVGRGFRPAEVNGASIVDQYATPEARKLAISRSRKPSCIVIDFYGVCGKHKLITPFDILGGNHSPEVVQMAIEKSREKGVAVDVTQEMKEAEEALRKKMEEARLAEASRKACMVHRVGFSVSSVNLFDAHDRSAMKAAAKTQKVVTPGMAKILRNAGYDPYSLPYDRAVRLMREQFGKWEKIKKHKQNEKTKKAV